MSGIDIALTVAFALMWLVWLPFMYWLSYHSEEVEQKIRGKKNGKK